MQDDKPTAHRHSLRLKDYDYRTSGAYFVTICTLNLECLLGTILDGEMQLNAYGQVAEREWVRSAEMRREIMLDEFVVMPNHVHGIVFLAGLDEGTRSDGQGVHRTPLHTNPPHDGHDRPEGVHRTPLHRSASKSLGAMINGYKAAVTRDIRSFCGIPALSVWQRNYYEHIIRNEQDLDSIREYIRNNPARWALDHENPEGASTRNNGNGQCQL
jgi:REP element-mobilizing transposase RayT